MATLPAKNLLDGSKSPATTVSEMKSAMGSIRDFLADLLGTDSGNKAAARNALGALGTSGGNLTGPLNEAKGADIASAATINLDSATGNLVVITGTATIAAITLASGAERTVVFAGTPTLQHNASLILPTGLDIVAVVGDVAKFRGDGSLVRCVSYSRYSGQPLVLPKASLSEAKAGADDTKAITAKNLQEAKPVLGTAVASTSGTSIDFTGIPSWAKRISVMFSGVSTNGSSIPMIRLGTSGGVETSGYAGTSGQLIDSSSGNAAAYTDGFQIRAASAATLLHGAVHIELIDPATNKWSAFGILAQANGGALSITGGTKALPGVLDRIRITTVSGTDTFDAGTINIMYE